MYVENSSVFVETSTSNYDCGVTLTAGWIHIGLDIGLDPFSINCHILSVGDSSVSQTTPSVSIVTALVYDQYTLGAVRNSGVTSDGMTGMIHSLKINDLAFDSAELNPTGKYTLINIL